MESLTTGPKLEDNQGHFRLRHRALPPTQFRFASFREIEMQPPMVS